MYTYIHVYYVYITMQLTQVAEHGRVGKLV